MHACFEPGSETDVMYMEVIKRRLQDNSILQTLEADPEFEVYKEKHDSDPKGLVKHEDVYMRTAMGGSRGIQMVLTTQSPSVQQKTKADSCLEVFQQSQKTDLGFHHTYWRRSGGPPWNCSPRHTGYCH